MQYEFCEGCGTDEGMIIYYSIERKFLCPNCINKVKARNFDKEVKEYLKPFGIYP